VSFFFDTWFRDGFVLVSEAKLLEVSGGVVRDKYLRKIQVNPHYQANKVGCAIVVCGDDPQVALALFREACAGGDTLRDIARRFGRKWTARFSPENGEPLYSAVHMVGFEKAPNEEDLFVPQMWYWTTWEPNLGYHTKEQLEEHLQSFKEVNPHNNHLHRIIAKRTKTPLASTLKEEYRIAMSFLRSTGAYITWNGDRNFWDSAYHVVKALRPVFHRSQPNTLEELAQLTKLCLDFLVRVSAFLPDSTLGFSPSEEVDIVLVPRKDKPEWFHEAKLYEGE
jgi:hypothetical protein